MTTEDSAVALAPPPASESAQPAVPIQGKLSIETEPSPLSVQVLDNRGRLVAQGVSPLTESLHPGLYAVIATIPHSSDLVAVARVISKAERRVRLSVLDPKLTELATSALGSVFDRYVHGVMPLPKSTEPRVEVSTQLPFWLRFQQLTDWDTAKTLPPPPFSATIGNDRIVLAITNASRAVVFAQIAMPTGATLNVALPPAGAKPTQCELVVSTGDEGLVARARLATDWANAAMHYMAQGYIEQARELVEAGQIRSEDKPTFFARMFSHIASRFDDPCAALVPRYLELRTGKAAILSTLGDSVLDVLQSGFADGMIISAEAAARRKHYRQAILHLNAIKAGTLPVFTEGFSLLVHRLRKLIALDPKALPEDERPGAEDLRKLEALASGVGKWVFHVDLTQPTLTFPGTDVTKPDPSSWANFSKDPGWVRSPHA